MAISLSELNTDINNIQCGQGELGCDLAVALKTGSKKALNITRKNTAIGYMLSVISSYNTVDLTQNSLTEAQLKYIITFASTLAGKSCNC